MVLWDDDAGGRPSQVWTTHVWENVADPIVDAIRAQLGEPTRASLLPMAGVQAAADVYDAHGVSL